MKCECCHRHPGKLSEFDMLLCNRCYKEAKLFEVNKKRKTFPQKKFSNNFSSWFKEEVWSN